ncbi:MAG: hypothetical protein K0B52_04815 [FCB group bacterium]|nr:hypothetical protein [FCB group bacterium]
MKRRMIFIFFAFLLAASLFAQQTVPKNSLLKSIVLPGWGETAYQSGSAYIFMGVEAALWLGFGGLRYSAGIQNRDLISYTRLHAGIQDFPESQQYWADMGNYASYEAHRTRMLENRTPEKIWDPAYAWGWDEPDNRQQYRELYRKKELALLSSEFLISGFIVNRIASVINVRYLQNKNMQLSAYGSAGTGGGTLHVGISF